MTDTDLASMGSGLALDVVQAALSLAVKHFKEGQFPVTDIEIGQAACLFNVGPNDADQVLLIYELLVAFGDSVAAASTLKAR